MNPTRKQISFNKTNFSLICQSQTSTGAAEEKSFSLAELNRRLSYEEETKFFQKLAFDLELAEGSCSHFNLADLFCRIERPTFLKLVQQIWYWADDFCELQIHLPHPRHDIFINDFGYCNALLPESFLDLDPQNSILGQHQNLGVRFEIAETQFEFDSIYENESIEKLEALSKTNLNVIAFFKQKITIRKSLWIEVADLSNISNSKLLTPEIEKQLREQYQMAVQRGDLNAAQVIQNFLNNSGK